MHIYYHNYLDCKHVVCSLGTAANNACCVEAYITERDLAGEKNVSGKLITHIENLANDLIHGKSTSQYPDWGKPIVVALKKGDHRLLFIMDHEHELGKKMFIFIHCYFKQSQKVPDEVANRCKIIRDAYIEAKNKGKLIKNSH